MGINWILLKKDMYNTLENRTDYGEDLVEFIQTRFSKERYGIGELEIVAGDGYVIEIYDKSISNDEKIALIELSDNYMENSEEQEVVTIEFIHVYHYDFHNTKNVVPTNEENRWLLELQGNINRIKSLEITKSQLDRDIRNNFKELSKICSHLQAKEGRLFAVYYYVVYKEKNSYGGGTHTVLNDEQFSKLEKDCKYVITYKEKYDILSLSVDAEQRRLRI